MADNSFLARLPGAQFGLAHRIMAQGYWSIEAERQMLRAEAATVDELLCRSGSSRPELRVWLILHHLYGCGLGDLFRYGLKPCFQPRTRGRSRAASFNQNDFDQYCDMLAIILAHPVFERRIELVRYALQLVVKKGYIAGHTEPLGPPYSWMKPSFYNTARAWALERGETPAAMLAEEASMSRWFFKAHHPDDFQDVMENIRKNRRSRPLSWPGSVHQLAYFLLTASHLTELLTQLRRDYTRAPEDIYATYHHNYLDSSVDPSLETAWMTDCKGQWLMDSFRERGIQRAMARDSDGDSWLLDIPPFDPDPLYSFDGDTTGPQLDSLYCTSVPGTEPASVLWCKRTGVNCR